MAGGAKETPRQKMVGMMYLVLTALLALQVSNAVLEKFSLIDESLRLSAKGAREDNLKMLRGTEDAVKNRGNRPADLGIMQRARAAVQETDLVLKKLEGLRDQLTEVTGGKDETGNLKGAKNYDEVMALMLGPGDSKKGQAYKLEEMINDFCRKLSDMHEDLDLAPIAVGADRIEQFKNNPDQQNKDFARLNFDHTPTVAAFAVLSQLQNEVIRAETKVLEKLSSEVGMREFPVDRLFPVVSPDSRFVMAGSPYKARIFMVATSSSAEPKIRSTAGNVKMNGDGIGELEFRASASDFGLDGKAKRIWKGEISFPTAFGTDTTFVFEEEYTVIKPTIEIESASVNALYYNCGNELNIKSPGLGADYAPVFTAEGGEFLHPKKKGPGHVVLIPKSPRFGLLVKNNGSEIARQKFPVKKLPLPRIKVQNSSGQTLNVLKGEMRNKLNNIKLFVAPDPSVASLLPRDTKYRAAAGRIVLVRGRQPAGNKQIAAGAFGKAKNINLSSLMAQARPGDRLMIEITAVERKNYKGETERINMPTEYINCSIF